MQTTLSSPVKSTDRAIILDVLRGFAILGILLDNMIGFTGYSYFSVVQKKELSTFYTDSMLNFGELVFVRGKFYSLFSLLFGVGFSIILLRNPHSLKIFYRRLLVLMLIGAIHILLIWEGDILFLYALIGLILPLFRNCSDKTLMLWALALLLSQLMIDGIKVLFQVRLAGFLEIMAQSADKKTGIPLDQSFASYLFKDGSGWQEWRNWLQSGWLYRFSFLIESNRIPKVLGMFLVGLYVGRKLIYVNLAENKFIFKKIRNWGFIIGLPCSVAMAFFEFDGYFVPEKLGLLDTLFYTLSVVPLTLAYVSTICLFWIRTEGKTIWRYLAPVGRMALSNYLMQTAICIFLCYGVGLGLGGDIGPTVYFPMVFIIYAFQVIFSNLWFNYFNYGPLEWIWRQLTYGKRLSLRKD